ncbi:hypothetical protein N7468_007336 [Penicillium chermesinum]|uniref:Uncharacterized protein n=1 Tax=Penicillium chermesinum TaxID=63820 RepID=A0A9W9NTW4_9EURO|nr:uncharacterized protein N7468_007336 [Penicillium chermesinum]KAJ5226111.1 hypothetical protein N7468_007336 [Penicillium chermesinum]
MAHPKPSRSTLNGAALNLTHPNAGRSTEDARLRKRWLRLQEQNERASRRSFKVYRWRVNDPDAAEQSAKSHAEESPGGHDPVTDEKSGVPPSFDQLLSLIHYNVFRGCYKNKLVLGRSAVSLFTDREPIQFDISFPSYSRVIPVKPGIPAWLMPSQSQMDLIHTTWINLLPFPKMRDNLIRWESYFDHKEFAADLMGHGPDPMLFPQKKCLKFQPKVQSYLFMSTEEDDLTTGRTGMILWGGAVYLRELGGYAWVPTEMGMDNGGL